jgi:hypothetical protein
MLPFNTSDANFVQSDDILVTSPESSTSVDAESRNNDKEALFYIITVLMFYAVSIVILMVKYLRQEKQEAEYTNYYYEYVSRDKFQDPQYQNSLGVQRTMKAVNGRKSKVVPREDIAYTRLAFTETSV